MLFMPNHDYQIFVYIPKISSFVSLSMSPRNVAVGKATTKILRPQIDNKILFNIKRVFRFCH